MKRTRWSHGHSIAVGILGGLLLAGHTVELLTIAFALGLAASTLRHKLGTLIYHVGRRVGAVPSPRPPARGSRARTFVDWDTITPDPVTYPPARARRSIAGVLDRVGRMLRDDESIPF